jgi:predicted dehydrogenase
VDSVKWLAGDRRAEWVYGSVFRRDHPEGEGVRYGHIVEDAAIGVVGFEGGLRAEFMWGELFPANRWYQDYEVVGSKGRLHRPPDGSPLPKLLMNGEPVELAGEGPSPLAMFAETVRTGAAHPMSGQVGLEDMEIVTALYLSARLRQKVSLPFESEQFPLELIFPAGSQG